MDRTGGFHNRSRYARWDTEPCVERNPFRVVEHIFDSFGTHYIRYLMRVRHGTDTAMAYGCVNECRRGYHATLYMDMRVNKAGEEVRSLILSGRDYLFDAPVLN